MKKLLIILLALFLILGALILWNRNYYCNPAEKDWYNSTMTPDIARPFYEVYDGSYTVKIDSDGNVLFKPIDGEEIKGTITLTPGKKYQKAELTIQFENGKSAKGICYRDKDGRRLSFDYDSVHYLFTNVQGKSKQEIEAHRAGLIEFLREIYEGGEFPTAEQIRENSLYMDYTSYHQIDPHHGGPIDYDVVRRATVEKVDLENREITVKIDGESYTCTYKESLVVAKVGDSAFEPLTVEDVVPSDCLVGGKFGDGRGGIQEIFYFE